MIYLKNNQKYSHLIVYNKHFIIGDFNKENVQRYLKG